MTGFYFDHKTGSITEPVIQVSDCAVLQSEFIETAFNFVFDMLIYAGIHLLSGIAMGMVLQSAGGKYQWYLVQQLAKESTKDG